MSSSPAALLYAELLSNIRQVSAIASLPTLSNKDTTATLSSDGLRLKVEHNGDTVQVILPAQVSVITPLRQPALGSREISWRLALPSLESTNSKTASGDSAAAPWSASKLTENSQISCRKCGYLLVMGGRIQSWRDLPSENWAEMMDFWHCHKPSIPKTGTSNSSQNAQIDRKGYGANNRFKARPGVGFVDLTYFLLSQDDCPKVKLDQARYKPSKNVPSREQIYCELCNATVGAVDQPADGIRLYKWSLYLSTPTSQRPASYALSYFITAHLLSQITSQAVNKFILHSVEATNLEPAASNTTAVQTSALDPAILQIWVFAPFITISVSKSGVGLAQPVPASKIFYRPISVQESTAILDGEGMSVEEVQLPIEVMTELAGLLRHSTASIPVSARKFREWDVGFLERFVDGA